MKVFSSENTLSSSSPWLSSMLLIPLTASIWQRYGGDGQIQAKNKCSFLKITFGHCLLHLRNTAEEDRKTGRVTGETFITLLVPWHWFALFCTKHKFQISQKRAGVDDCSTRHDSHFTGMLVYDIKISAGSHLVLCSFLAQSRPPIPPVLFVQLSRSGVCVCVCMYLWGRLPHRYVHTCKKVRLSGGTMRAPCCWRQMFIQLISGTNSSDTVAGSLTLPQQWQQLARQGH